MHKIGLKLWSINKNYLKPAQELFAQGIYDYIELYSVPGSFEEYNPYWQTLKKAGIPFLIHAPHFDGGLNFALKEKFETNMALAKQAQNWADILEAKYIIFHPGIGGDIRETARQINILNEPRLLIENKPYNIRLGPDIICNGHNPQEIGYVLQNTGAGFCLDIGHAICAANSVKTDKWQRLQEFLALKPSLIHISDGDNDGILDSHQHLGAGSYDLKRILSLLPKGIPISIETEKNSIKTLEDFRYDVSFIKEKLYDFDLRPAADKDLENMFTLANMPEVRNNSFSQNPIVYNEHCRWFKLITNDPESLFFIIEHTGAFAGYVRFRRKEQLVVSVAVSPPFRGQGLAVKALRRASFLAQLKFKMPVTAFIMEENIKSLNAFIKAGYIKKQSILYGNNKPLEMELPYDF